MEEGLTLSEFKEKIEKVSIKINKINQTLDEILKILNKGVVEINKNKNKNEK